MDSIYLNKVVKLQKNMIKEDILTLNNQLLFKVGPWVPQELICLCVHSRLFDTLMSTNCIIWHLFAIDIMPIAQHKASKTHHRSKCPWVPQELMCLCMHGSLFDTFMSMRCMIWHWFTQFCTSEQRFCTAGHCITSGAYVPLHHTKICNSHLLTELVGGWFTLHNGWQQILCQGLVIITGAHVPLRKTHLQ